MSTLGLNDLDELLLTVRNRASRMYISEAINAYRGKAYRSAIISTWIAVTYDIITKIRELAVKGDRAAETFVNKLDIAIANADVTQLSVIENGLLKKAYEEFEFLSKHECSDLERLKEDRNNCAHPAFADSESLFQPTSEITRTHIVHAILHLLRHQPVQGKAAIDRFLYDIRQPYFPSGKERISEFLTDRYLNRAKGSLIRNLIITLTKLLLQDTDPDFNGKEKILTDCLITISENYSTLYDDVQSDKLSSIVETLDNKHLINIFKLLSADPNCWRFLSQAIRIQIQEELTLFLNSDFVEYYRYNHEIRITDILKIDDLNNFAMSKFPDLNSTGQSYVISANPLPGFTDAAINAFVNSSSYASAKHLGDVSLLNIAHHMSSDQISYVLNKIQDNNQILPSRGMEDTLEDFFDKTIARLDTTQDSWAKLGKILSQHYANRYSSLLEKLHECQIIGEP